ncbi:hypothetical protein BLA29_013705 [Euroglyphus maynei]|uniref:Uncharacterized protein n=1 Tax=Euroglyphus maynei TaxID=6958 RepID=A0A1Y3AWN7_EURMA|nr:hypothetical protein BLA29_013705 [Euroglyphus maynei]
MNLNNNKRRNHHSMIINLNHWYNLK